MTLNYNGTDDFNSAHVRYKLLPNLQATFSITYSTKSIRKNGLSLTAMLRKIVSTPTLRYRRSKRPRTPIFLVKCTPNETQRAAATITDLSTKSVYRMPNAKFEITNRERRLQTDLKSNTRIFKIRTNDFCFTDPICVF